MRLVPTVVLLAVLSVVYIALSVYIVALYSEPASKANHQANEALETCLHSIEAGRQALDETNQPMVSSNFSTFAADTTMHWALNQTAQHLHHLQLTSIRAVISDIEVRVQAAVHLIEGLILAWKAGFITTCNMDSSPNLENTIAFFKQITVLAESYPGFFRYIYFAEPASDNRSHWIECGWTGPTAETGALWAMGNAQRWTYWGPDPTNVRNETILYIEPVYHLEDEFVVGDEFGGFYDWYGEGLYYEANVTYAFAGFILPVYQSSELAGYFGLGIQLDFLVQSMRRSMATPSSLVFIVDVRTERVVAHTNPNVPQYPPRSDDTTVNISPDLFSISEIPDDFIRFAIRQAQIEYVSLANAFVDGVIHLEYNGTAYVQVNSVYRNRKLHWLVCQLTNASYFSYDVVEASQKLARTVDEAHLLMMASSNELNSLNELALTASISVASTKASVYSVRSSHIESVVIVAIVLAVVFIIQTLIVIFLVRPVRRIALRMDSVAKLQLEGEGTQFVSTISEMDGLWKSFSMMVLQLVAHKQYVPPLVFLSPIAPFGNTEGNAVDQKASANPSVPLSPGISRRQKRYMMSPQMSLHPTSPKIIPCRPASSDQSCA